MTRGVRFLYHRRLQSHLGMCRKKGEAPGALPHGIPTPGFRGNHPGGHEKLVEEAVRRNVRVDAGSRFTTRAFVQSKLLRRR